MMGPIIPGIVAKVFVMPRRIPAYLQKHFYRGLLMCYIFFWGGGWELNMSVPPAMEVQSLNH